MWQKNQRVSRKEANREKAQAKRNSKPFIGTCSNCRDKRVLVTRFRNGQLCLSKCLTGAISKLGGVVPPPADKVITAGEPFVPETLFTGKIRDEEPSGN